jgi:hypothetical protein
MRVRRLMDRKGLKVDLGARDSRWYAWVSGFTAVDFVDLESVSYADGTG